MPTIVHFDIPADDLERAKNFYSELFGWKIEMPPGFQDYYLIETGADKDTPGVEGGLGQRQGDQKITIYVGVDDIDDHMAKVTEKGGQIVQPKMPVPGWGFLAICLDTEGNTFGLWQESSDAA